MGVTTKEQQATQYFNIPYFILKEGPGATIKEWIKDSLAKLSDDNGLQKELKQCGVDLVRAAKSGVKIGKNEFEGIEKDKEITTYAIDGKIYNQHEITSNETIVNIFKENLRIDETFAQHIAASFHQAGSTCSALGVLKSGILPGLAVPGDERHFFHFTKDENDQNKVKFENAFTVGDVQFPGETGNKKLPGGIKCDFGFDFIWNEAEQKLNIENITYKLTPVGKFKDALIDRILKAPYRIYDATEKASEVDSKELKDFLEHRKNRDDYHSKMRKSKESCILIGFGSAISIICLSLGIVGALAPASIPMFIVTTLVGAPFLTKHVTDFFLNKEIYNVEAKTCDDIIKDSKNGVFDEMFKTFEDYLAESFCITSAQREENKELILNPHIHKENLESKQQLDAAWEKFDVNSGQETHDQTLKPVPLVIKALLSYKIRV